MSLDQILRVIPILPLDKLSNCLETTCKSSDARVHQAIDLILERGADPGEAIVHLARNPDQTIHLGLVEKSSIKSCFKASRDVKCKVNADLKILVEKAERSPAFDGISNPEVEKELNMLRKYHPSKSYMVVDSKRLHTEYTRHLSDDEFIQMVEESRSGKIPALLKWTKGPYHPSDLDRLTEYVIQDEPQSFDLLPEKSETVLKKYNLIPSPKKHHEYYARSEDEVFSIAKEYCVSPKTVAMYTFLMNPTPENIEWDKLPDPDTMVTAAIKVNSPSLKAILQKCKRMHSACMFGDNSIAPHNLGALLALHEYGGYIPSQYMDVLSPKYLKYTIEQRESNKDV